MTAGTFDLERPILSAAPGTSGTWSLSRLLGAPETVVVDVSGAPTGQVGVITVGLITGTGSVVYADTTAGIEEIPAGSGRYVASIVLPPPGVYFHVWTLGSEIRTARLEVGSDEASTSPEIEPASKTLFAHGFPPGTIVEAFPGEGQINGSHPSGATVAIAAVAENEALTFIGLSVGRYVAWAGNRGVSFRVDERIDSRITAQPGRLRQLKTEEIVSALSAPAGAVRGITTLTAGTVAVASTAVTGVSRILLSAQDDRVTGALRVSSRTTGSGFTITSSVATDSGIVAYEITEP